MGRSATRDPYRAGVRGERKLTLPARVWRVGYIDDPLNPAPAHLYGWQHRFDDILQRYRTVYSAEQRLTAFREVLQDLRPNAKAIADYESIFGRGGLRPAGRVTWAWREKNVLAPARIEAAAGIPDVADAATLQRLEGELAGLLSTKGIAHLDVSALTSKNRDLTQRISRVFYDEGDAGLQFPSDCDAQPCFVLFEHRGSLVSDGDPEPCVHDIPELLQTCSDYDLVLERKSLPPAAVRGDPVGSRVAARLRRLFGA